MQAVVRDIRQETGTVKTFYLEPEEAVSFKPGQFVLLHVDIGGMIKRAYSLSSSPTEEFLSITVKLTPDGKVTPYLFNKVQKGDALEISGPMGKFTYEGEKDIVLISGGTGIAPMRSIIRYCADMHPDTSVTVLHSSKTPDDIVFGDELGKFDELANITVHHTFTSNAPPGEMKGRIDKEMILSLIQDIPEKTYFLCGSAQFAKSISGMLKELGVPRQQIKRDVWG